MHPGFYYTLTSLLWLDLTLCTTYTLYPLVVFGTLESLLLYYGYLAALPIAADILRVRDLQRVRESRIVD